MTKREQRALAAGFITLEDTLHRTEDALQNGSVKQALSELLQTQHTVAEPTVRAWTRRGLMVLASEQPTMLTFPSVVDLRHRLQRLRETAGDAKRWQSLLAAAADQRELAEPGAREGLADALAGNTEPLILT